MRIEKCQHMAGWFKVHIDANELDCGYKKLPYPTCIGLVNPETKKIDIWTPAAYKPRGYRKAAQLKLEDALNELVTRHKKGEFYVTTFCNRAHDINTGRPISHNCYVLDVDKLRLEAQDRIGEIEGSIVAEPRREVKG